MAARGRPPTLRAVKPGDKAVVKRRVMSVTQAAEKGDHLDLLHAMRKRVATAVEDVNTPARDLAALTRRLHELAKEIAAIEAEQEGDDVGNAADTADDEFDADTL